MKFAFILFISLALALATAVPVEEHLVSEDAKSAVAELLQAGKSETACKDLAKASIKEVNDAIKAAQKIFDTFDDGSKCKDKGKSLVDSATSALKKAQGQQKDGTKAAQQACTAPVTFAPVPLSSLKDGKCAVFEKDPAYTKAKKKCTKTTKAVETGKGVVQEANKGLMTAEKLAEDAKLKCDCATQKAHEKIVEAAKKANSKANKDVWDKAHNMECVLNGKDKCTFKGVPTVKVPKMDARVAKVKCTKDKIASQQTKVSGGELLPSFKASPACAAWRVLPSACGGGNVAFAFSKSNVWKRTKVYECPKGWHWAKTAQYKDYLKNKHQCFSGSANSVKGGWAMYGQCGWKGFVPPPGADQTKHKFLRFADSATNKGSTQSAGNQIGYTKFVDKTSDFAGVVCMKNGF